jgi:hypothetical protein
MQSKRGLGNDKEAARDKLESDKAKREKNGEE